MHSKTCLQASLVFCMFVHISGAHATESASTKAQAVEQVTARAIEMYQQANSLYLNQQFAEAYELYKAAWSLRPNYKVAGNLGNCEYDLHKYRDAAEHLEFALRENPEQDIAATRTYFTERLADATRYVGTLEVEVDNAAVAVLFVDDKPFGKVPQAHPIYVDPGQHDIFARNYKASETVRFDIKKGEKRRITLHILPPPPKMTPQLDSFSLPTYAYLAGTGLSVALIAGGIYMIETQSPNEAVPSKVFWGTMIGGGGIGLITLATIFGATRTKEAPIKVSGTIVPMRGNWYVGIGANF